MAFRADSCGGNADGANFVMAIQGYQGATYNFSFALAERVTTASYIKLTAFPVGSQGGSNAFSHHPDMSTEIVLGTWGKQAAGHQSYEQYNPGKRTQTTPAFGLLPVDRF
jgi:hypothetical protein